MFHAFWSLTLSLPARALKARSREAPSKRVFISQRLACSQSGSLSNASVPSSSGRSTSFPWSFFANTAPQAWIDAGWQERGGSWKGSGSARRDKSAAALGRPPAKSFLANAVAELKDSQGAHCDRCNRPRT